MPDGDIETYQVEGMWRNRVAGSQEVLDEFWSREEAILVGRDHARERMVEHVVHNHDGSIGRRQSYRSDSSNISR